MASAVLFERHPFERTVRWRTVANELSMTLVVRRCFQCSAGKSKKTSSASRSLIKHLTALSYLTPQVSTKASNAANASFLVSAIQISCSARLAFGCWLFGSLFRTFAVLCTQQRCPHVLGHTCSIACQKPSAPSATASSGAAASPRRFRSREQLPPGVRALAHAVDQADQLLLAFRCRTDDHEQTLRLVFQLRL